MYCDRVQGGDPRAMTSVVREQLGEIDPTLPVACAIDGGCSFAGAGAAAIPYAAALPFFRCALAIGPWASTGVSYSVARRTKNLDYACACAQGGDCWVWYEQGVGMI